MKNVLQFFTIDNEGQTIECKIMLSMRDPLSVFGQLYGYLSW